MAPIKIGRTTVKTTLLLAAGLMAVSTTAFAQNFVAYPQSYGSITQGVAPRWSYVAPNDRFTRSDLGYQGSVTAPRHKTKHSRAAVVSTPAPGSNN